MQEVSQILSKSGYQKLKELPFSKDYTNRQIIDWVFKKGVISSKKMSNISKVDRAILETHFDCSHLQLIKIVQSGKSSTTKLLLKTADEYLVEAVAIGRKNRDYTLCISSQIGCSFACSFCATGTMKLSRNLKSHEIIQQFLIAKEKVGLIKNIVFMGMGEPLINYREVIEAIEIISQNWGFNFSPSRISVSTSGVVPGIKSLIASGLKVHLQISLHSAIQKVRNEMMPDVAKWTLLELSQILQRFHSLSNRDLVFEYIMIDGVNDNKENLQALINYCLQFKKKVKVNLIAYNHVDNGKEYRPSDFQRIHFFTKRLNEAEINAVQRYKKGDDIAAACGQLVAKN